MNLFDLNGKRALITGGTHGLGMAMAKGLGFAGAELLINGRSPEKMKLSLDEYSKVKLAASGHLFDVTNDAEVYEAVDRIEKEIGPMIFSLIMPASLKEFRWLTWRPMTSGR